MHRHYSLALIWVAGLTFLLRHQGMRTWVAYLIAANVVTCAFYGWDKWRAKRSGGRVPEGCLHMLALIGGVLGAWAGQRWFRHKTVKRSFQWIFRCIAVVQLVALFWWLYQRY